jgi:hypothetical protein
MKNFMTEIKYLLQRLFRSYGCSDRDLWCMDYTFAKMILPKLAAYRKTQGEGYPVAFMNWNQLKDSGVYKNKQAFDKAVKSGDHVGGGAAKWEQVLDTMIFGFEFVIAEMGTDKEETAFRRKHGDYVAELPSNKQTTQWYKDGDCLTTEKTKTPYAKEVYYFNEKMYDAFEKRSEEGLAMFGRFFRYLHD